ncbi:uncharacterized protein [Drosophila virilis]|uniref:CHK kinase-like domain-containing protein n=1 Tax=Drosophila virilis TaxID=7244 RepID=B4LUL9_DROVI|nr:uncharacterized protein LOC6628407 [Drosophila virilis]EDW64205.1 uncharacterized protein Dvir_GJ17336 [Drosophila virilis]
MLLTQEECVQILKNLLNIAIEQLHLLDFQVERDISAVGYLGDYYTLSLSYCTEDNKTPQQQQLFVKALPEKSDEPEKETIFRKEAWLYDNLLTDMQKYSKSKWSAKCYFTRSDLLVLENIKHIGYSAAPKRLLDADQLHQLLRSLAAFHASSLVYEQRNNINIGHKFGDRLLEITIAPHIAWYTTGLSAILAVIKSLPQYQTSQYVDGLDDQLAAIARRTYEQVAPSTKYRNVICHRDLWAGNIFFSADPTNAGLLIDFQTSRYTPPAVDLSFSIYLNLATMERRRLEANCIDFYYNCLQQNLQDFGLQSSELISKAELLQSYEEFRLLAAVYSAAVATVVKVPPAFVTNEFKYVDRSDIILDYMRENEEFRACMVEYCVEIMEIASANL